jgi:EmrB/QacA subfamily drug resistance transporter
MDMSITNISFPALTRIFNSDASVVLWVSAVYSLVSAGLTPIFGRIGDTFGRKKVFILGLILFTAGLGLCAISQNIIQLILARAVQGVGGAMVIALSMAIVTAAFPDNERGRALGILSSCFLMGPLIGPTVGGFLLDTLGWRSIFYFRLPLGIIVCILTWILLREQKSANVNSRLDLWGAAVLISGISCLVLFFNIGGRVSFSAPPVLALAAGAIVLLVIFVIKARKTENPIVDLTLFNSRVFSTGNITAFIHSLSLSQQALVVPFYLIDGRNIPTLEAGLLMSIPALFISAISPVSGWLSDKVGSRVLCPAGMALSCFSMFLLSRLGSESTYMDIIIPQALFGIGDAIFISPNTSMILGEVPKDKLGVASALMSTIRTIAMASGVVIAGVVFTTRQAFYTAELAGAGLEVAKLEHLSIIGGFQDTMLGGALFLALGTFTLITGLRKKRSG